MTATRVMRQIIQLLKDTPSFDRNVKNLKLLSAAEGKVHCEMPVLEEHLNLNGTLHGGLTATIVDSITTFALASCEKSTPGVSTDLNVSYLSSAKVGDTLSIKAEVLKQGNTLGFTTISIENQHGKLIATGRHTKFLKV